MLSVGFFHECWAQSIFCVVTDFFWVWKALKGSWNVTYM